MLVQYGTEFLTKQSVENVSIHTVQMPVNIIFPDRTLYDSNTLFTVLMRDPDAPDHEFMHYLVINAYGQMTPSVLLSYIPPQKVGHRYVYEIYLQQSPIVAMTVSDRQSFDLNSFINRNNLSVIARVIVNTISDDPQTQSIQLKPVKYHGFIKNIGGPNAKYCTCDIEVEYKNKMYGYSSNPYAVCSRSTGGHMHDCRDYYDFESMPIEYLLIFVDRHGIVVPDRTSRLSAVLAIRNWKK